MDGWMDGWMEGRMEGGKRTRKYQLDHNLVKICALIAEAPRQEHPA